MNPTPGDVAERRGMRVLGRPTLGGLLIALLSWLPALTPTLIPRTWITQAVINAVVLAVAYGLGTVAEFGLRRLRSSRPGALRNAWWFALGIGWLIAVVSGAAMWVVWQNDQRSLMGMETVSWLDAAYMAAVSALGAAALVIVGRLVSNLLLAVIRLSRRLLPEFKAAPVLAVTILVLGVGIAGWGLWQGFTAYANVTYGSLDASTDEGTLRPISSSVSGSSGSLVSWETLGRWGRNFVAGATTADELESFHGPEAEMAEPVRVFVGLGSADSVNERAELAVRDLDRAGGFDREVLAVWVPTGTGWMIPEAAEALELLHRGDTAIVGMQYSLLPSLLAVFISPGLETETGEALFEAVHSHWPTLPQEERPKLVLFGKSLGTHGVETPFVGDDAAASITNLRSRSDGALIVGAKRTNPIHSQLTQERDAGSPVWQPIVAGGRSVRFLNQDPNQPPHDQEWAAPKVAYLQHPSDPVPFWGIDALWRPPEWMDQPRGFDVPEASGWFPVVTGAHAVADLIFQLSTPPGFGHVYSTDYVEGWVAVVPPTGWTDSDTRRLEEFMDSETEGESEL